MATGRDATNYNDIVYDPHNNITSQIPVSRNKCKRIVHKARA